MTAHIIDSDLFQDSFSTAEMRSAFTPRRVLETWIAVEVALAKAQAEHGVIPAEAAAELERQGRVERFDTMEIGAGIKAASHTLMSFLRRFQDLCHEDHRGYLHWGATTQDIVDTGAVLRFRQALDILEHDLTEIHGLLRGLAEEHAETVMPGRTHGQHALPVTFGYKAAVWYHEVSRHLQRLAQLKPRVLVGNLTGAVGTMAFVGAVGTDVQRTALGMLGLGTPEICWHSSRDRVAELSSWLAMASASLGKIAREVVALQKTDVGELEEPFSEGKVGSSTMPQKRNPSLSESIYAKALLQKTQASLGFEVMMQEHERDKTLWQVEWEFLPEMFLLAGGIAGDTRKLLGGLVVRGDRMRANLEANSLTMAEAVMGALSPKLGRDGAHDLIYDLAMATYESGGDFAAALKADPTVGEVLNPADIDELLDPMRYTGLAAEFARSAAAGPVAPAAEPAPVVRTATPVEVVPCALKPRAYDSKGRLQIAEGDVSGHGADRTPVPNMFLVHHYDQPELREHPGIELTGKDGTRRTITLEEIQRLPARTVGAVLECAGNARGLRSRRALGTQFGNGMFAQGEWTGVSLGDVLAHCGQDSDWGWCVIDAPDQGVLAPENVHSSFAKGLPRGKALHPDTILAWQLNGAPVPDEHGGPLRLVVPGWYGIWWVKWPASITLTDEEFHGFWQHARYTYQDADGAIQGVVRDQVPRAVVTAPDEGAEFAAGQSVRGLAWAGEHEVVSVEVTLDDGATWARAQTQPADSRWAWTRWSLRLPEGLPKGVLRIGARATDATGRTQTWVQPDDRLGYATNAITQVSVDLVATQG